MTLLEKKIIPDFEGLKRCILRQGEPQRVYQAELMIDEEIKISVADRFGLLDGLNRQDPYYQLQREIRIQEFLGYELFRVHLPGFDFPGQVHVTQDTTRIEGQNRSSRSWVEETQGPIQSWRDFELYPWPDIREVDTRSLEWLEKNLPGNMAVYELTIKIFETLMLLFGYESLCFKLMDEPDLVEAVSIRVGQLYLEHAKLLCQFSCVGVLWGTDDLGFKSQLLMSPGHLRKLVVPWHERGAKLAHDAGKLYFLHSCGNTEALMEDFIETAKIDAKHSFEDEIMPVKDVYWKYGDRIGILGGIDIDFLCRAEESAIRKRVRQTLDFCHPGGGYCLGTGNSVTNYIPVENYLAMLDEGRRYI